jgi:hypothetical protein
MTEGTENKEEKSDRYRRYPSTEFVQETFETKDGRVRRHNSYDIRISSLGLLALAIADISLLTAFTYLGNIFLAIASAGIATFIGTLCLADYVSIEPSVSTGEMRGAIAGSIIVVYLIVVSYAFSGVDSAAAILNTTIIQNLTTVVGIVVVFYFGSKAVLQYVKDKKE